MLNEKTLTIAIDCGLNTGIAIFKGNQYIKSDIIKITSDMTIVDKLSVYNTVIVNLFEYGVSSNLENIYIVVEDVGSMQSSIAFKNWIINRTILLCAITSWISMPTIKYIPPQVWQARFLGDVGNKTLSIEKARELEPNLVDDNIADAINIGRWFVKDGFEYKPLKQIEKEKKIEKKKMEREKREKELIASKKATSEASIIKMRNDLEKGTNKELGKVLVRKIKAEEKKIKNYNIKLGV